MPTSHISFGFMNAPIALLETEDRLITSYNKKFSEMFGYSETAIRGRFTSILYPTTKEFVSIGRSGYLQMKSKGFHSDERIMLRKDGSLFWCRVKGESEHQSNPFKHCVWSFEELSKLNDDISLTMREREVALLLCRGLTSKEIAAELNVSPRTIDIHRSNLLRKYKVRNVAEFIATIQDF